MTEKGLGRGYPGKYPVAAAEGGDATYYDLSPLKKSDYRTSTGLSFLIAGASGAIQLISAILDFLGHERDRRLVRTGRYLALAGSLLSPAIFISTLKTPVRWFNMLRIFKPTSPMSLGIWSLTAFSAMNAFIVVGQLLEDIGVRAGTLLYRVLQIPAALVGSFVSVYMGTELEATSTPLWAEEHPLLPGMFGVNSLGSGIALLDLFSAGRIGRGMARRLSVLGAAAGIAQLIVLAWIWRRWNAKNRLNGQELPLPAQGIAAGAVGLGIAAPLAGRVLHAVTGKRSRISSLAVSLITILTGLGIPTAMLLEGNASAERPLVGFRFASPPREEHLEKKAGRIMNTIASFRRIRLPRGTGRPVEETERRPNA